MLHIKDPYIDVVIFSVICTKTIKIISMQLNKGQSCNYCMWAVDYLKHCICIILW